MNKVKKNNIVNFPGKITEAEREVEAIIFAAAEPLSVETIESKITKKIDVIKTLEKLKIFILIEESILFASQISGLLELLKIFPL
tara:strand:+ start:452 stop:706 length:255 start_codon:yes stop_codon:yes gene_type:complete